MRHATQRTVPRLSLRQAAELLEGRVTLVGGSTKELCKTPAPRSALALDEALSVVRELRTPHMQLGECRHCAAFARADALLARYPESL